MNMTFVSVTTTVLLLPCERSNVKALFQCNYFGEEALGEEIELKVFWDKTRA